MSLPLEMSISVSKRTVQLDIQMMRSDKLGYNAPIIVYSKKYYTYDNPDYTITQIPITGIDMDIRKESVEMLGQFKDFSLFSELNGVIQKLEDKIHRESKSLAPIIHMEKNENLKGLEHLDTIYQAILKKIALKIDYQSFKARKANTITLLAYILKEYNNRWFVVGRRHSNNRLITLALDRIEKIGLDLSISYELEDFSADNYYENTYGVTVMNDNSLIDIHLKVDQTNAPYVLTKPFHRSQEYVDNYPDGSILITLRVHHNYEIERLFLGFGSGIEVLKPRKLRNRIKSLVKKSAENYGFSFSVK